MSHDAKAIAPIESSYPFALALGMVSKVELKELALLPLSRSYPRLGTFNAAGWRSVWVRMLSR